MCGIAGFISAEASAVEKDFLIKMASAIWRRGPDDSGVWLDSEVGVGLAHCRLSILDISPAGHQPMISKSGRYVLTFNGEIYNHLEIRSKLNNYQYRGHSDTETLLAGIDEWGVKSMLKICVGMFAFALWDKSENALTLGRDRLGEKPLYYGWQGNTFLFGSELKALKAHPSFKPSIDRNSLALMMRHNSIPSPYSIYEGIKKLVPGSLLKVSLQNRESQPVKYWDITKIVDECVSQPYGGTAEEAVIDLEKLLRKSVARQMVADVPLGAFLSGGVDSSTVVALMQTQSEKPVKTFSIGFHESDYNEAEHAKKIANHLRTEHTELYVSSKQAMDVISSLPALYDEPFSDSSQIPTYLVSSLAKRDVSVTLSGDGGDELFCGYNRYTLGQKLWGKLSHVPMKVRILLAQSLISLPPNVWNKLLNPIQSFLPVGSRRQNIGEMLHKGAGVISANTSRELYGLLVSHWTHSDGLVLQAEEVPTELSKCANSENIDNFIQQMMLLDMSSYMPDDVLTKLDRASMGVSLEARVPLLDHNIVEFAWKLPLNYKLRNGVGKWPLRKVLYKYVPQSLIDRPKMGFGVPIDSWLRSQLKDWAEDLLDESRLRKEGYFNVSLVRKTWEEHQSGRRNWQYQLWDILMFQAWLDQEG